MKKMWQIKYNKQSLDPPFKRWKMFFKYCKKSNVKKKVEMNQ